MTPTERLIHNERVKLDANFMSRLGFMLLMGSFALTWFIRPITGWILLYIIIGIIAGFGLNIWGFLHIRRMK